MSAETSAWAKQQLCGDRTLKAVLREIANWARPDGMVEYLSVKRIAEVVEVTPRTVQRAIAQLEPRVLNDNPDEKRLGLIRRVERFRPDGGQGACGFELVGYQPPLSLEKSAAKKPLAPHDKMSPPPDADVTPPGDKMSGEGVTPVSPLKRDKNILPLSTPDGVDAPPTGYLEDFEQDLPGEASKENAAPAGEGRAADTPAQKPKPHPLPDDWQAPAVSELQPEARSLVSGWPPGAYQAMCANFRNYWRDPGTKNRKKADWRAALCNWLIRVHSEVMRASKAGVSYANAALPSKPSTPAPPLRSVAAKAKEDATSKAIHAHLREKIGEALYQQWFAHAAILHDTGALTIISQSEFASGVIENRFGTAIAYAAHRATGQAVRWVRFFAQKMNREEESMRDAKP